MLTRRRFVTSAATAAGALGFAEFADARDSARLRIRAEGVIPLTGVIAPVPAPIPPDVLEAVLAGHLEFRQQVVYPVRRGALEVRVFISTPGAPPVGDLAPAPESIVSVFRIRPRRISVANDPEPAFVVLGTVAANPIVSPFGDLTGRLAAISAGFISYGDTALTMLGGFVAGSHSTWSPVATGVVRWDD
jgi:hypothetical protein